ncbi:hypothetical protein FKM82_005482 [Ascaphus truei]
MSMDRTHVYRVTYIIPRCPAHLTICIRCHDVAFLKFIYSGYKTVLRGKHITAKKQQMSPKIIILDEIAGYENRKDANLSHSCCVRCKTVFLVAG